MNFPVRGAEFGGREILVGGGAGLAGGVAMGIVMQFGTDLLPVLGSVTGEPSLVLGWIVHLLTSVVFGVAFAVLVALPLFHDITRSVAGCVLLGVVHASVLATAMIGLLLPLVVSVFELSGPGLASPEVPGPVVGGFVGAAVFAGAHLVYGVVLGAVYAYGMGLDDDRTVSRDASEG